MALPSSGPLSLNDIRVELQQSQANSSLRSLSNLAGFSTPDAVSEFYGYSYANYNYFEINDTGYSSSSEACNFGGQDNLTLYFAGSGGTQACPSVSNLLYTNTALTQKFDGAGRWYKSNLCNASYYILGFPDTGFVEGESGC